MPSSDLAAYRTWFCLQRVTEKLWLIGSPSLSLKKSSQVQVIGLLKIQFNPHENLQAFKKIDKLILKSIW